MHVMNNNIIYLYFYVPVPSIIWFRSQLTPPLLCNVVKVTSYNDLYPGHEVKLPVWPFTPGWFVPQVTADSFQ